MIITQTTSVDEAKFILQMNPGKDVRLYFVDEPDVVIDDPSMLDPERDNGKEMILWLD